MSEEAALIGRVVAGKFRVLELIGGGAMGSVYRARQTALDKDVAVKVMHRTLAGDPQFAARFHREAKAASRLDHPNSMRVIDFGEEPDGLLYIAMEYLQGQDLEGLIQARAAGEPMSAERAGDLVMQALAAIAVAHDMGVIHRDLKPENIMVLRGKDDEGDEADLVKVCDFGIAKITEADPPAEGEAGGAARSPGRKITTAGLVIGTPEYMSPEQARGEKLDARSDIYSMGIILYQLLTGSVPFTADTALAIVLKHLNDEPEPPRSRYPGAHEGLEAVCLKAIAKAREDRFQTAREMRSAIRAALDGKLALGEGAPSSRAGRARDDAAGAAAPRSAPVSARGDAVGAREDGDLARAATLPGKTATVGGVTAATSLRAQTTAPKRGAGTWLAVAVLCSLAGAGIFVAVANGARTSRAGGASEEASGASSRGARATGGASAEGASTTSAPRHHREGAGAGEPREPKSVSRKGHAKRLGAGGGSTAEDDGETPEASASGAALDASAPAPAKSSASAPGAPASGTSPAPARPGRTSPSTPLSSPAAHGGGAGRAATDAGADASTSAGRSSAPGSRKAPHPAPHAATTTPPSSPTGAPAPTPSPAATASPTASPTAPATASPSHGAQPPPSTPR